MPGLPRNISDARKRLLSQLPRVAPVKLRWDEQRGVARVLRGDLSRVVRLDPGRDAPQAVTERFVRRFGHLAGPPDLWERLAPARLRVDRSRFTHLEYQVRHPSGLEVYGARVVAHFDGGARLVQLQSSSPATLSSVDVNPKVTRAEVAPLLARRVASLPGFARLAEARERRGQKGFPLVGEPRLVLHPWNEGLRLAYVGYGFGPAPERQRPARGRTAGLQFGRLLVDARSGEVYAFHPARSCMAEVPADGSGVGVDPRGSHRPSRSLHVVRVEGTSTYRLRDTTRAREILVYDAGGDTSLFPEDLPLAFADGTLPLSSDTQGDHRWARYAGATSSDSNRTASQQPEVEAAFLTGQIADWYSALEGGRDGWDDGRYAGTAATSGTRVAAAMPVRVVTHFPDPDTRATRSVAASFEMGVAGDTWFAWIALSDGNPRQGCAASGDRGFEYPAASRTILAHEYQHGITNFSHDDGSGSPGLFGSGPASWYNALHEGLADAMGCLFANDWQVGRDVSRGGMAIRNLAFPRDASAWMNQPVVEGKPGCGLGGANLDHLGDAGPFSGDLCHYNRGTIVGHFAYLLGAGGVHVRTQRAATYVPVRGIGTTAAARILHRAVTEYLGTLGVESGVASVDAQVFFTLAEACRSAAADLFGADSREAHTTYLALYAVGLSDPDEGYGADVTFVATGAEWKGSRAFVGLAAPDAASPDLVMRSPGGAPWQARWSSSRAVDNDVYCRVRNVGDATSSGVRVELSYALPGESTFRPVRDAAGVAQVLTLGPLPPGAITWLDTEQESPPPTARLRFSLPAPPPGQRLETLRLRAVVTSAGDANPFDKEVISEIACVEITT